MGLWYPLINKHSYGTSAFFMGKTHYKWPFSVAMSVYQRVFHRETIFLPTRHGKAIAEGRGKRLHGVVVRKGENYGFIQSGDSGAEKKSGPKPTVDWILPICSMYGIFTYMTGWFLGQMMINIPSMVRIWDWLNMLNSFRSRLYNIETTWVCPSESPDAKIICLKIRTEPIIHSSWCPVPVH